MKIIVRVLAIVVLFIHIGDGARILGIVPTPSISHQVVFQPLWRELSLRGHQVTTITTDPIKDPTLTNLTEIDLHFSYEAWNKIIMKNILAFNDNPIRGILGFVEQGLDITDQQLRHPSMQSFLKSEDKFDLAIIESVAPVMIAFAEKFQCPFISMTSMDGFTYLYKSMGNPTHPVLFPDSIYPYYEKMSLAQRLGSVISTNVMSIMIAYSSFSQDQLVKKYFGENYPSVQHLMNNASLLFVNSDPILHKIRPLVPTVVQIGGGSHLRKPKPLPHDLKEKLDNEKNGFIYFSLGSNVKSKDIPMETRTTILETFSELPYTVLWKFEAENLSNKPDNVIISKWLPQQDVLRHPNIKLFITQGGLQSSDETIHIGVPIVGMPFFGDQAANIKRMVAKGMGLSVEYTALEKNDFKAKILEIIQNPKYRNRVKELAALAQDQPMTGLERAIWWSEYVIRHKGAAHLRSPLLDIPWYQYLLLDVIAVLLFGFTFSTYILYILVRSLLRLIRRNLNDNEKKLK
ncbi:hypothetical protein RI129_010799 [Pyrocoelia pectoralis]|uniref:UDP-glucuronosyltransferase n=1 Tax=Pyrocoelia pectoralis TaxID=417401 RepID=A0AAN7V412_9COLE